MKKISLMFIALVAAVTMSANKFTKVTAAPADWSGQYLLTYNADSVLYVFNGKDAADGYTKAKAVNDTISSEDLDGYVVEFATMTGGYSFKWLASGKYMSGASGANSLSFVTSAAVNTIDFNNEDTVEIKCNSAFFVFNSTKGQMRFRYFGKQTSYDAATYKRLTLYKVVKEIKPEEWTPDTLSVTEARALISASDPKMAKSHYIYGVVSSTDYGKNWPGWAKIWMTDIDNPTDSLEGFQIYKDANSTKWASAEEIPCGLGDTIMLFADGLGKYGTIYETTSGYYVKTLGKSSAINGNEIFKYGFGAIQKGQTDKGLYKYEFVLSKKDPQTEGDAYDNALHMIINSQKELGIAGSYTVRNYQSDSSYVDGEGPAEGSLKITYVEETSSYNKYSIKSDFTLGGKTYRIDSIYEIPGYDSLFEETFKLVDDVPYKPKPGDTLTCAQAAEYAASLGSATGDTVYVRGFVTGVVTSKYDGRAQQSPYMADDATATKGVFQAYMGYTQNRDSIVKGDEIIVYGPVSYYAKSSMGQIKNGQIYRVGGSDTQRPIVKDNLPEDAITVAAAMEIAAKLGEKDTSEVVTIKGYVTKLYKTFNGQYSSQSFYIDDKPYEEGTMYSLEAFQSQIAVSAIVGDFVFVKGRITPYVKEKVVVSYNIVNSETKFTEVPTGFEEIKSAAKKMGAQKVMMNGQMFIMKDGVLYNALGSKVQ